MHTFFCVRHTPAGLGQIVVADLFYGLFEKTLWLSGEVVLFDTAISKTEQKAIEAVRDLLSSSLFR